MYTPRDCIIDEWKVITCTNISPTCSIYATRKWSEDVDAKIVFGIF
jgi:hypothetical protein